MSTAPTFGDHFTSATDRSRTFCGEDANEAVTVMGRRTQVVGCGTCQDFAGQAGVVTVAFFPQVVNPGRTVNH